MMTMMTMMTMMMMMMMMMMMLMMMMMMMIMIMIMIVVVVIITSTTIITVAIAVAQILINSGLYILDQFMKCFKSSLEVFVGHHLSFAKGHSSYFSKENMKQMLQYILVVDYRRIIAIPSFF